MKKLLVTISAVTLAIPAFATDFERRSATPEYSGPSARIESRGMERDAPRPAPSDLPRNDLGYDARVEVRKARVQSEMDRRRDEIIRANQRHILHINE